MRHLLPPPRTPTADRATTPGSGPPRRRTTLALASAGLLAAPFLATAATALRPSPAHAAQRRSTRAAAATNTVSADGAFTEAFFDDFDGPTLDRAKWRAVMSGPHHSGMRWNPAGVEASGGTLRVAAERQPDGVFTGAGVAIGYGPEAFGVVHGRIEMRARVEPGHGTAPALMGWPSRADRWPPEFDLMEATDGTRRRISVANHWEDPARPGQDNHELRWVDLDATDWHSYRVEWTPSSIAYAVDGREVYRSTDPRHTTSHPMTAAIGMFVGTPATANWIPQPDRATPNRVVLHLDWVRVSHWTGADGGGGRAR
jgi:hypothetical protein